MGYFRKSLATLVCFLSILSCKTPGAGSQIKSADGVSDGNCRQILTDADELTLVARVNALDDDLYNGMVTIKQRDEDIKKIISSVSHGNQQREGAAKALAAVTNDISAASYVMNVALNELAGLETSQHDHTIIASFGIERSLIPAYLADVASSLEVSYKALTAAGFKRTYTHWQFEGSDFSKIELDKNAKLRMAIAQFFSASVLAGLLDDSRVEAIITPALVFGPVKSNKKITVWGRGEWERLVQRHLKTLEEETTSFIKATKEASSYSNLMKGRIAQWFGGERGLNGKTAPEIQAESSYKIVLSSLRKLISEDGVNKEMRDKLYETEREALAIESKQLEQGLNQLALAEKAAIAAPFIPILLYAAPFAGGLLGPEWAPIVANAATGAAAMPFAFAMGKTALSVTVKTSTAGGDWRCHLYDTAISNGSGALYAAPFAAAIPIAAATGGWAIAGVAGGGTTVAVTSYGYINLAVAIASVKPMVENAIYGGKECYQNLKNIQAIAKNGDQSAIDAMSARAYDQCLSYGIDLSFSIIQIGKLTRDGWNAIKDATKQPEGTVSTSTPTDAAETNAKSITPEELAARVGKADLTSDEDAALVTYGGNSYREINAAIRDGTWESDPNLSKTIQNIDSGIAKAKPIPKGIQLYRGEKNHFNGRVPEAGEIITMDAFTSTSILPEVANGFGNNGTVDAVKYYISVPESGNARGFYMNTLKNMPFKGEQEILLPRGSQFKVIKSEASTMQRYGTEQSILKVFVELVAH